MTDALRKFYIDGQWIRPDNRPTMEVINPATEEPFSSISLGNADDVDSAVSAARQAFPAWSQTSREQRLEVLDRIVGGVKERAEDLARAVSREMGAPIKLARKAHVPTAIGHFSMARRVLADYDFDEQRGTSLVTREPIGVCGLITPWNWPLNQTSCKIAPALAAGCTILIKPSERSPISAHILSEIIADSGMPAGVFNLVQGDGPTVGTAIASHPEIDLVSFTGSTRAGRDVARRAADSIKRVTQELGGKSPNIILDDADFARAVAGGVTACFNNSGQSCHGPTRMLVPGSRMDEAIDIARGVAEKTVAGDPADENVRLGPVVSKTQFDRIQDLIQRGIDEGAELAAGGPGKPEGLETGYFVRPTVLARVSNDMTIAREEIFGPVLVIIGYGDDDDAVRLANDSEYGLAGFVAGEPDHARRIARRLRVGMVHINGAAPDFGAPFGGYRQSGNGREWGVEGFEEFLEIKSIVGYYNAQG